MHDGIKIIQKRPSIRAIPFYMRRGKHGFVLYIAVYMMHDGMNLGWRIGLTDDKIIRRSFVEMPQVQFENFLSFFILNTIDYECIKRLCVKNGFLKFSLYGQS